MALIYSRMGDVGPALAPYDDGRAAAQAAGAAAAAASRAVSAKALATRPAPPAMTFSPRTQLLIGASAAGLLILIGSRVFR